MKRSFKAALLASTMLTAVASAAVATPYFEGSTNVPPDATDFPNSATGTAIPFATHQDVFGVVSAADQKDFFTFTGLTIGDSFSVEFANNAPVSSPGIDFGIYPNSLSLLGSGGTLTLNGILSASELTIEVGVDPTLLTQYTGGEGYHVTLSESAVPEPASLALFSVGLGGLAATRRRRRRR